MNGRRQREQGADEGMTGPPCNLTHPSELQMLSLLRVFIRSFLDAKRNKRFRAEKRSRT